MKKLYKIFFLLILLVFLSTFNPYNLQTFQSVINFNLFNVKNIEITNNYLISKNEIKLKLQNITGKNIFFLKNDDLVNPLYMIEFLHQVEIKKKYPNTIKIKIYEEKPIGILNKKKTKFFVCESSKLIPFSENFTFENLPEIFGENSEIYLSDFFKSLKKMKFPIKKIKNVYYFKIGRWNLKLMNGQTIKLPFEDIEESIKLSVDLLNKENFKKYKVIDLRISGKIITE